MLFGVGGSRGWVRGPNIRSHFGSVVDAKGPATFVWSPKVLAVFSPLRCLGRMPGVNSKGGRGKGAGGGGAGGGSSSSWATSGLAKSARWAGSGAGEEFSKPAWFCKNCVGSKGSWRNSGGSKICTKCCLPKGVVYLPPAKDPASRPSTSLAERQSAELSRQERAELQLLRLAAARRPGEGGAARQGKGKGHGKAASAEPVASSPASSEAAPEKELSAADRLKHQEEAQTYWKKLQLLQQLGVVAIAGIDAVQFPELPPAHADMPWEGRLQKAKNMHNEAWSKLKATKQKEVEAVRCLGELEKALVEARQTEVLAKEVAEAATKAFEDAAQQLHEVEDEQRGGAGDESDGDADIGPRRGKKQQAKKPEIPADEAEV